MKKISFKLGVSLSALVASLPAHSQVGSTAGSMAPVGAPATSMSSSSSGDVSAQDPAVAASQADNKNSGEASDIVVTANKREQNLSKVGLSISALGAQQLANQRISNVADLAQVTPGLTFAPTPTTTPVYTLRGVGFFESTLAAYPDVSLYIDQAPLPLPVMSTLTAFDLERVEVLKGPQGTLFGNNATGGAINFVAAKPTATQHGGLEFGYSRFNTLEASGFLSGPLTDTLGYRVAFKTAHSGDGWQKSYTRNDSIGKENNIAGRMILDWAPIERLKFSLNVNAWQDKDDPQVPQKIANGPQNPVPDNFPLLLYPAAPRNARAADWGPTTPYANTRFKQVTLRGDYDLGAVTLTSITGYSITNFLNGTEIGGTALGDLDNIQDKGRIKSLTQEVRLSNGSTNRLRWVFGGNYERTTVTEQTAINYQDTSTSFVNGITTSIYPSDQRMRNIAGFANAEFDVTDQITLKAGVRQTRAERSIFTINHDDPSFPPAVSPRTGQPGLSLTDFFNTIFGAIYGGVVPTIAPFGNIVIDTRTNSDGTPVNPSTYLTTQPYRNKLNENSTSWSGGVDFKPSPDTLLYVNISKGYKAGSFPQLAGSIYTAYSPVKQESIIAYEAGLKLQLFDRKLSLSGAGFLYDYRNKQLRAKFVDPIFNALDLLVNVPKSQIKGAELSIDVRPSPGLTLSASGTYLDASVRQYNGVIGSTLVNGLLQPVTASFKGVRLPFAPKFQYTIRVDYDAPITSNLNIFAGAGANGQTSSISSLALPGAASFAVPTSLYKINSRTLVNATIGVHASDNAWRLALWGKNIFNKYYWNNDILSYDTVVRYTGRPAEYGVSASFNF